MTIKHLIRSSEKDLGGFSVRRLLPYAKQRMVGPWIFFDHMGPAKFPAGKGVNVRPHPHINLATVTYLFEGEILHRDSLGTEKAIRPGDINLMVAGRGIAHSERERDEVRNREHVLNGLQLWHALPESAEETDPAFHHYPAADIPESNVTDVPVRVMMGSAYGVSSPVRTFAETLYLEARLLPGKALAMPGAEQQAVYVVSGRVQIDGKEVDACEMAILSDHSTADVGAVEETQIAVIGGEKFSERFIEWNFVSSRKERIEQAKADWASGKFPKVPGDEDEFIPLPGA